MNRDWLTWTAQACRPIRFKHDRRAAERELLAHLEDEALALMESGLTREQAQKKALAAMGDAEEVGRQLAAVHRPWLGYLWICSRWMLILCIVAVVGLTLRFSERMGFGESNLRWWQDYRFDENFTITELSPECWDRSDGYTFTVPAAAVRSNETFGLREEYEGEVYEYTEEENTALYLTVRAVSLLPSRTGCAAFQAFYAVDDRGNYYWSWTDPDVIYTWQAQRSLAGKTYATGLWTTEHGVLIREVDPEASWIELRYDREGRDVRLRIDLTGGEDA